jgi:hypothetical protein
MNRLFGSVAMTAMIFGSVTLFAGPAGASSTQAGYSATASSPITSFTGSIDAPLATCPSSGDVGMFMRIQLVDPSTQEGVSFLPLLICNGGTVSNYIAEAQVNGPSGHNSVVDVDVTPGDILKFTLTQNTTKGTTTGKVEDVTTGFSGTVFAKIAPSMTSISALTYFCTTTTSCSNVSPIPSFSKVTYSHLTFNGALLSSLSPTRYDLKDGTVLQVTTSKISTLGSFSTTFEHA